MRFKRIFLTDYVFKIALGFAYDDVSMLFEILWGVHGILGGRLQGSLVEGLECLLFFMKANVFLRQYGRRLNDQDYYSVLPESRFKMAWGDMGQKWSCKISF